MKSKLFRCITCEEKSCAVATLSIPELEMLSNHIAETNFQKGEVLFRENTLSGHIVYLKRGLVKLHIRVSDQKDHILKIAVAPTYLGLSTVFGDRLNQYSATALAASDACFIEIGTFKELIHTNGRFAYEIIADISRDELHAFRRYAFQTHQQSPGRLACALLFFASEVYHNQTFILPLTRRELGELIGATRENVTRNLSQLKEDGIIEMQKNRITLLKREALERINKAG